MFAITIASRPQGKVRFSQKLLDQPLGNTTRIDTPSVPATDAIATCPKTLSGLGPTVTELGESWHPIGPDQETDMRLATQCRRTFELTGTRRHAVACPVHRGG
jgi:hypothetical protein